MARGGAIPARAREPIMDFDWSVVVDALPALLGGARLTVLITLAGLAGGLMIGFLAGLMRAYGNALLNAITFAYIELIRGTPIVVQVMFIYFALPALAEIRVNPMTAAITAIIVNAGAYISEVVRGSFLSVHKRSEEHTSELQSLIRISYAVLRLTKKNN